MAEYIDKAKFERAMYREVFIEHPESLRWDEGFWTRYILIQKLLDRTPCADVTKKKDVLKIIDDMIEIVNANWNGDEVLIDMLDTIRNKILEL